MTKAHCQSHRWPVWGILFPVHPYHTHKCSLHTEHNMHLERGQSCSPFARNTCLLPSSPMFISIQKISTHLSRFKLKNCMLCKSFYIGLFYALCWIWFTRLGGPIMCISSWLPGEWLGILKSTMLGIFLPRKSANSTNKYFSPLKSLFLYIYQHLPDTAQLAIHTERKYSMLQQGF